MAMLRPYRGVDEWLVIDVMEALEACAPLLRGASPPRELVAALWAISHLGRQWALASNGMLQRNNLISEADRARLAAFLDAFDLRVAELLDSPRAAPRELTLALHVARRCGWVWCDWQPRARPGAPNEDELDEFVFRALGDDANRELKGGYSSLSIAEARHFVAHLLEHSMSYGPSVTGSGRSSELAEPFFAEFSQSASFYTTYVRSGRDFSFSPKTLHTFDAGVVAVDAINIGLIWFADED